MFLPHHLSEPVASQWPLLPPPVLSAPLRFGGPACGSGRLAPLGAGGRRAVSRSGPGRRAFVAEFIVLAALLVPGSVVPGAAGGASLAVLPGWAPRLRGSVPRAGGAPLFGFCGARCRWRRSSGSALGRPRVLWCPPPCGELLGLCALRRPRVAAPVPPGLARAQVRSLALRALHRLRSERFG